jgi:purine-binding chemotaxis protein CheW
METTENTYVTFTLAEQLYGMNVGSVQEILEAGSITRIPRMPTYMKGVVNVRNRVLPVVDLRARFGLEEKEATVDTAIIVADLAANGETVTVGCRADAVDQVLDIPPDSIEPPPRIGTEIDAEFVSGIASTRDATILVLDPDRLFARTELEEIDSRAEPVTGGE